MLRIRYLSALLLSAVLPIISSAATSPTDYRRSPYVGAVSACEENRAIRSSDGTISRHKEWHMLCSDGADNPAYIASVTKLMTLLLVIEDIRAGKYTFDKEIIATDDVVHSEPSWMGLKAGDCVKVKDLCLALMVESANDAAIVLGVNSAGSFNAFIEKMNARAVQLGMKNTRYYNPNGLPPSAKRRYPWKAYNVSTANDQLKLAMHIVKFPEIFDFTSVKTCDLIKTANGFRVSVTRQAGKNISNTRLAAGEKLVKTMLNHNEILRLDKYRILNSSGKEVVDGLKTGYIDAGGSSLILTGKEGDKRVIVVVLGSSSKEERDSNAWRLMMDALMVTSW